MTYTVAIITDPEAFDASFYGSGAPESFFTESFPTYPKYLEGIKIIAARFPEARIQGDGFIPEGLIEEARNPAPEAEPVEPYTGPAPTFEELFGLE